MDIPLSHQVCLEGVLCKIAVLQKVGVAIYALVRFEKESVQRRRAIQRHQSNAANNQSVEGGSDARGT